MGNSRFGPDRFEGSPTLGHCEASPWTIEANTADTVPDGPIPELGCVTDDPGRLLPRFIALASGPPTTIHGLLVRQAQRSCIDSPTGRTRPIALRCRLAVRDGA